MGNKERRAREREQMREDILDAAIELFHELGFEKTTIRRIADKIEYTPGNIYAYFKNKNDILFGIHQRGFKLLYDMEMTVVDTPDPSERLIKLGQTYIQFGLQHRQYYDLMFIDSSIQQVIHEDDSWQEGQSSYTVLRDTVAECIQTGALPPNDADSITFGMWAFVHGLVSLYVRGRSAMIPDEYMPQVLQASYTYFQTAFFPHKNVENILNSEAFVV
ncbi:MAG: TetR/AcrR family transcriptional regulator [Candidatus Latescibacteria bacterium]|nr:TetR/AcrR family transcriptional regulator [Candidatus Latescibacterota bacterium]